MKFSEFFKQLNNQIIAHRGAPCLAPENTQISFEQAAAFGAEWLEFDVQVCASGDWVVFHDDTLERTSNGEGKISEHSYDYLKQLDVGSWFSPKFKDCRIPLLAETLTFLNRRSLKANIEIKSEQKLSDTAIIHFLNTLEQHWPGTQLPPLISSFRFDVLQQIQKFAPELPLGFIVDRFEPILSFQASSLNLFSIHCDFENLQSGDLDLCQTLGLQLLLYTVNDPKQAKHYFEQGICALFSDHPNLMDKNIHNKIESLLR